VEQAASMADDAVARRYFLGPARGRRVTRPPEIAGGQSLIPEKVLEVLAHPPRPLLILPLETFGQRVGGGKCRIHGDGRKGGPHMQAFDIAAETAGGEIRRFENRR